MLLGQLAVAGKIVARELARAALVGQLGSDRRHERPGRSRQEAGRVGERRGRARARADGARERARLRGVGRRFAPRRGVLAADTSSASTPSTGRRTWMSTGSSGPSSRPGGAGGPGDDTRQPGTAALHGALRRLARRRLSPHTARRRDLSLPARGEPSVGEAPPPLRGGAHGLPRRAGGRPREHRTREIMTIDAATPHARVPLVIGSPDDVAMAEDFIGGRQWRRSG